MDEKVYIFLRSQSDSRRTEGMIQVKKWSKRERSVRALKAFLGCWAAALLSVLFPLIHFVLVPSLLFAGPVAAFYIFHQDSLIIGGSGACPHCSAPLLIERSRNQFPLSELCTHCQSQLIIKEGETRLLNDRH